MDHIPPRSLFPESLPSDIKMVTAPSCQACQNRSQKNDATIRNILVSDAHIEQHPSVVDGLAGKRNRSFQRTNHSELRKILPFVQEVELQTPAGIYTGKGLAINYDNPIMDQFVERLSRGLLWHEFQQEHFCGTFSWGMNVDVPDLVYEGLRRFGAVRRVSDIFAYGLTKFGNPGPAWIIASFYGWTEFLIQVFKAKPKSDAE